MPFHLVTGRANAGKTGVIAEHIARTVEAGLPAVMVLPSQADVSRAREEFARKCPIGLEVTTFDRWLEDLWSLHGDGRRLVSPLTRDALVNRACAAVPLKAATASAETRGFQKMVSRIVARLCDVPPATVSGTTEREIGLIVDAYNGLLARQGLIEPARAAAALASAPPRLNGLVVANRFVDLSEAQERLFMAAGERCDVVLALVWEQDYAPTEALDMLMERLRASAADQVHCNTPDPEGELGRIEAMLYAPGVESPHRAGEPHMLELGVAAGTDAEIELIAERVHSIVAGGTPEDRTAVAFRDTGSRATRMRAALEQRGLASALDVAVPLSSTPYGRALLALLDVCLGRAGREGYYSFLISPFSAADPESVISSDRTWRRYRIEEPERLLSSVDGFGSETKRIVLVARSVAKRGVTAETGRKWKELADLLLAAGAMQRPNEDRALDAAAHRAVVSSIQAVLEMHGSRLDAAEFVAVLRDAQVSVAGGDRAGRVQITDVSRLRSRRFDAVIIGGLTADEFSSEYREPLAAHYIRELGGSGGTDERLSERLLFYLLVTRAREKLVLVRRGTNEAGEPLRASVFWEEVVDLYRSPDDEDAERLPEGLPVEYMGMSRLETIVPASTAGRDAQRQAARGALLKAHRRQHAALTQDVVAQMATTDVFSVTELEAYLQCPYKWFYGRAVRPREIDSRVDARQAGTLAHEMMRTFYEMFHAAGYERMTPQILPEARRVFEDASAAVLEAAGVTAGLPLAEEFAVRRAYQWAQGTIEADATFLPGYKPVAHECRFGFDGLEEAVVDGVKLRGSIDRIELGPAGVVVIDYKTGSSQVKSWQTFEPEGHLQPAIYALAAADMFDASLAGGVYRRMGTHAVRGFWRADRGVPFEAGPRIKDRLDEAGVSEVLESAVSRMHSAVDGIRAGRIAPAPLSRNACMYCGARVFCTEAVS